MRTLFVFLVIAILAPAVVRAAKTPEEMTVLYFDAFKSGDMETVAANMHEGELAKFKEAILPVVARNLNSEAVDMTRDAVAIRQFAGRDSLEKIQAESPKEFFLRFMNWMTRMNPMVLKMMTGATMDALGHVEEEDMAHIVCRVTMDVMGAKVTQMKVMSVKKQGDEWRLMLTGEIEGMTSAIKASE